MKYLRYIIGLFLICCFSSCSDDVSQYINGEQNGVYMIAEHFIDGDKETRSVLIPNDHGTSFQWEEGDVAAVYSSAKGMTNFFIDESSISQDKLSANFYGSGFSLLPSNTYYAFYPYGVGQTLDRSKVPVNYNYQKQYSNGDFNDLGNFDYMCASGISNDQGRVGFNFKHLGCVVEYKITIPKTAVYNKLRLELDAKDLSLIKQGTVDLTAASPLIEQNSDEHKDSIISVILNGTEGLELAQDSILTVYMMMAPQDLSGEKLIIRLVDIDENWYSACVDGKNMRAGYTYHYAITNSGDGGFTGSGSGLPDDENLVLEKISTFSPELSNYFEDFAYEDNLLYAVGNNGIVKVDYNDNFQPHQLASNDITSLGERARGISLSGNYVYVSQRQNSGGLDENKKPDIRLTFESNMSEFVVSSTDQEISNNEILNTFFEKLYLCNKSLSSYNIVYIYKAASVDGEYRNSILFSDGMGSSFFLCGNSYKTKEEAYNALKSFYSTSNGDYCLVDWNVLSEGKNIFRSIKLNSDAIANNGGITNNTLCNMFFQELRINSKNPTIFNKVYLYKAYPVGDKYRNSILFSDGQGTSLSFLGETYSTQDEALNALSEEYFTSTGDYCKVNWSVLSENFNIIDGFKILINYGQFDNYIKSGDISISETGVPCPNTGLHSARLISGSDVKDNDYAQLSRKLDFITNTAELSLWINIRQSGSTQIEVPLLLTNEDKKISLIITPDNTAYRIGFSNGSANISNHLFKVGEWYNIKFIIDQTSASLYWREKECGNWNKIVDTNFTKSFDLVELMLGMRTSSSNVEILVDDYYYHPTDIDEVSYVNGKFVVLNKSDLKVVSQYNLDLKGTDIYVVNDHIILNCLKGFNIYDISEPEKPILKFTHRDADYTEYQGADFYTLNGRLYMVVSNYNRGISIWDMSDFSNPVCLIRKTFEGLVAEDGTQLYGTGYGFDLKVDYPYVYATWANNTQYMNTPFWHIGLLTYNISNLSNITMKLTEIPISDRYSITTDGDKRPTRIAKYEDRVILNNSNKGIALFNVKNSESPYYEGIFETNDKSSINPVFVTTDGKIFVGDNNIYLFEAIK